MHTPLAPHAQTRGVIGPPLNPFHCRTSSGARDPVRTVLPADGRRGSAAHSAAPAPPLGGRQVVVAFRPPSWSLHDGGRTCSVMMTLHASATALPAWSTEGECQMTPRRRHPARSPQQTPSTFCAAAASSMAGGGAAPQRPHGVVAGPRRTVDEVLGQAPTQPHRGPRELRAKPAMSGLYR